LQTSSSERVTPHQELENGERKRLSFSASCTLSERMFPAIGRKPDEKHVRKPFVWKGLSAVALQASAIWPPSERATATIIRDGRWHPQRRFHVCRWQLARSLSGSQGYTQRRFHLCPEFPPRLSAIVSATLTCLGTLVGFMRMERSRLQAASIVNRATVVRAGRSHGNGLDGSVRGFAN
jgi:hypothetical protein